MNTSFQQKAQAPRKSLLGAPKVESQASIFPDQQFKIRPDVLFEETARVLRYESSFGSGDPLVETLHVHLNWLADQMNVHPK